MNRRERKKSKAILWSLLAVLLIAGFGLGLHFLENWQDRKSEVEEDDQLPYSTIELKIDGKKYISDHNIATYLLIGIDDSEVKKQKNGKYKGGMADFLMLLVLDKTANTYGILPINRNTITDVRTLYDDDEEESITEMQICVAHDYGSSAEKSAENTVWAVKHLLGGLKIDGYYAIHMSDLSKLNHSVGGVEVTIPIDMTNTDPAFKAGTTLTLSDTQAEKFIRARMEVGDGGNISRMERQKLFLKGLNAKVKTKIKEDNSYINDIYGQLSSLTTDLDSGALNRLANTVYKSEKVKGSDESGFIDMEGKTKLGKIVDDIVHEEFYPSKESMVSVLKNLLAVKEK